MPLVTRYLDTCREIAGCARLMNRGRLVCQETDLDRHSF